MQLDELLTAIQPLSVEGATGREIKDVCYDSRRVKRGSLFVAMKGEQVDGAEFIPRAVDAGAEAIVTESDAIAGRATKVLVKNAREALADVAAKFYGDPQAELKIAAITGTNGKTTTTFLLKHISEHVLWRAGLIGTVQYQIADRVLPASRTTPESLEVHQLLRQMVDAGCKTAAMEVSSHALCQARVRGVEFDVGVFTNLTQDHLDYHKTMEEYFQAKASLFTGLAGQKKPAKAVVNIDDSYGQRLVQLLGTSVPIVTYGQGVRADFRASNLRVDFNGTSYQLDANGKSYLVRLPLIGAFNVYNSLAAIAAAWVLQINVRQSLLALAGAPHVPGRLQPVLSGQRLFKVFVDYAHTDDALLNVIKTCRELKPRRLIVLFGCGGNRDRGKRPRMGKVVNDNADWAIVTSDNPRREEPKKIIEDILPGMTRGNYEVILDRHEAIYRAIDLAGDRDIVLIAGKGHETYQEFADHTIPFDDAAIAASAIADKRGQQQR
jgi:UDP-N-acetylmuramoyl-L-alanyl-D-glutamate--2,6-diaminopimelate ligase